VRGRLAHTPEPLHFPSFSKRISEIENRICSHRPKYFRGYKASPLGLNGDAKSRTASTQGFSAEIVQQGDNLKLA